MTRRVFQRFHNARHGFRVHLIDCAAQAQARLDLALLVKDRRAQTPRSKIVFFIIHGVAQCAHALEEAQHFADAIHETFPEKMLAYNCSPSFNWRKNLDEETIARFQSELGRMGYKFQFVTMAGFHALNLSMFELAHGYQRSGMSAYSELQEREFECESRLGYDGVKHQRFVGTGYLDDVQQVISEGAASTVALADSTETAQFWENDSQVRPDADSAPVKKIPPVDFGPDEMLLPSGD